MSNISVFVESFDKYKHNIYKYSVCSPESLEFAINYKPTHLDRILLSHPKCGTFWTEKIMHLIINWGTLEGKDYSTFKKYWIDFEGQEILNTIESERERVDRDSDDVMPLKTHLCYDLFSYNKSANYLLILRNPKDVCVSSYYYTINFYRVKCDLRQFVTYWIRGDVPFGDYFNYVKQYWIHCKNEKNFSILVYEEMLRDIKQSIETIAQFLGQKYVNRLSNDDKLMNQIIEKSSFHSMKEFHEMDYHFRKGVVGDWRSHLTKDESDLINKRVAEEWMGTGLELLWKEEMKWIEK